MISNRDGINYNLLSDGYDKRYDYNDHPEITLAINNLIPANNCVSVLEAGAGTCHWLKNIRNKNVERFGIDISLQMLLKADKNSHKLNLVNGDAQLLPFKRESFDMIFCVNALHYFRNKSKFFAEAFSALRGNGLLAIYTFDPRTKGDHWYIYDYFEGVYEFDLQRFLSVDEIGKQLTENGFENIQINKTEFISDDKTPDNIFNDPFLEKGGSSQTAMLSGKEYERGMEKIKNEIKEAASNGKELIFPVRLTMFEITGRKPKH